MKINKTLIILSLLLIFCISLGAVNAADNAEMSVNDINNDVATIESSVNVDEINVNDGEIHYSSEIYEEIYNATGTYNITHDYQINKTWEIPNPNVIIEGNNHTIYGNGKQAFNITGNNVTIKNLKFVNCSATGDGGAIYWSGNNGVLSGCSFVNCSAVNGGAICFGGSGVSVVNCSFVGCSASDTYGGGAIYFYSFSGSDCNNNNFSDCSFINNTAICGGAISFVSTSDSNNNSWTGCDFINNTAGSGGAIYFYSGSGSSNNVLTVCDFINNTATVCGGAISFVSTSGSNDNNSLSDCSFINNTAETEYGGAICFESESGSSSNNSFTGCNFTNCSSKKYGGAICFKSGSGNCDNNSWTDCSFINNTAETGCGGAICFYSYSNSGSGSCENNGWTGCSFINNTAAGDGGAIYFMSHSDSGSGNCDNNSWSDCSFINNTAETGCGGAISFGGVTVFIGGPFVKCDNNGWTGCDFINNTAEKHGGAIYFKSGSGNCDNDSWTDCSFINNTAETRDGGAIYFRGSSGSVNYCIFENNTANNGGAIYIDSGSVDVDYNFFGFQNNITDFPSGLIKGPTPTHWVVLNISEFGDEYVVKFIDNEGNNLTDVMPDYTASLTFNNKNTKEITIKNNTFKNNLIPGNYKVNSINTGELLALFFNDGFADLNNLIYSKNGTIVLDRDYKFYEEYDNEFINGIVIDKNITIDGNGHTIDGLNLARVFNVTAGTVTFKNINFVNCSGDNGGAIYSSGSLIIGDNVSFVNNNATGDGGVIYISSGSLTLNGTNITFNDNVGNDIYLIGSTDNNAHINVVTDCVSTGNSSPSIYLAENSIIDSNTIITVLGNQTITKNKNTDLILNATVSTGGLSVTGGSFNFVIGDKTFNATDDDGDGIFTSTRTFEVPEGTTVVSAQDYNVLNSADLLTVKTGVIIGEAPTVVYIAITGDGGSDMNQGTFDSPVATLGKALDIVKENGTIIFKDGYFLVNDQKINISVAITSLNATTVLQPSSNNRILNIANGCTVTLSNLTLENGYAENGGAIYTNGGSIIIGDNMEFINNIATGGGAIYSGNGSVVVSGSNVSFMQNSANVGGAIYSGNGSVVVSGSNVSFINNIATGGGAIYSNSSLVVNGSNIKFNTNSNYDIYLDVGSSLNITTNCYSDAPASIYKNNNATIVSEVVITVLDNSTIYYRPGFNCNVTVTATTGNLTIQGITMNLTINGTDNGTYDFNKGIYHKEFTVDFVGVVPIGAKITNVGLPNCKVLNATISSSLNYIIYISTTGNDTTGNGSIDNPVASLKKALEILPINGKIIFKNGTYYPNNVVINKNVNITGDGEVILSGNSTNRILNITGGTVIISNLIFKDGNAYNGGAISCVVDKDVQEPLNYVFENCYFEGNTAENYGGALEIEANYVNVINCTFVKNTAKRGAAINIIGSHVNVKYSLVLNNTDSDYGAVYLEGGDINIYNLTLNYNTAKKGAAIYIKGNGAKVSTINFNNNTATDLIDGNGGAIFIEGNEADFSNIVGTNNTANKKGGAVYILGENSKFEQVNLTFNKANLGGAIYIDGNKIDIRYSVFINNSAIIIGSNDGLGGAIYIGGTQNTFTNCNFTDNKAVNGSAIYWKGTGVLRNVFFDYNQVYSYALNIEITPKVYSYNSTNRTVLSMELIGGNNIANAIYNADPHIQDGYAKSIEFIDVTYGLYINGIHTTRSTTDDHYAIIGAENSTGGTILYLDSRENHQIIKVLVTDEKGNVILIKTTGYTDICGNLSDTIESYLLPGLYNVTAIHEESEYYASISNSDDFEVLPLIDLKVDFEGKVNDTVVIWTVNASNIGLQNATKVILNESLFKGNISEFNCTKGTFNPTSKIWEIGNLASGEEVTLEFKSYYRVGEQIFENALYNIANITGHGIDTNLSNNYMEKLVSKIIVNVTCANVTVAYGENATVEITISDNYATGNVTVHINGEEFNATLTNGHATVIIDSDDWSAGNYLFNVTYSGDDYFHSAMSSDYLFNITQISVNIISDNISVVYGNKGNITVYIEDIRATGDLVLHINDKTLQKTLDGSSSYVFNIDFQGWSVGEYIFNVTYAGDGNFTNATSVNYNLNITENCANITVDNISCGLNSPIYLTAHINDDATGFITFYVDGEEVGIAKINNGISKLLYYTTTYGNFTIKAIYEGNAKYSYSEVEGKLIVNESSVCEMNVTVDNITYGEDVIVDVTLPIGANRFVRVYLDGVYYGDAGVTNGKAQFNFTSLNVGEYNVTVEYAGDNLYPEFSNSTLFTVTAKNVNITLSPITNYTVLSGENYTVTFTSEGEAIDGAKVIFELVNGDIKKNYTVYTDSDGKASLPINLAYTKEYIFNIYFNNTGYEYNVTSQTIIVTVGNATFIDNFTDKTFNSTLMSGDNFTIQLVDDNKGIAGVYVDLDFKKGETGTVVTYKIKTDSEGNVRLPLNLKCTGDYYLTAKYGEISEDYTINILKSIINPSAKPTNLTNNYTGKFVTTKNSNKEFVVKLTSETQPVKNAIIKFELSNKNESNVYYVSTDSNGEAKLAINLSYVGNYTMKVVFEGNNLYAPSNESSTSVEIKEDL